MATTPEQHTPSRVRPRSRMMSWNSPSRHDEDSQPRPKVDLTESSRDKARSRMSMNTKADPSKAMFELQPGQAQQEATTRESLRDLQHKDSEGNVITDPDRSNPTRPRMERPLDTIRSFEAAMDGGYNRKQPPRPDTAEPGGYVSRRSSYHQGMGGMGGMSPQPRFDDGYYNGGGHRGYAAHPAVNGGYGYGQRPESYADGYRASPAPYRGGRPYPSRGTPDPALYGANGRVPENGRVAENGYSTHPAVQNNSVYAQPQYQQSYETATTASGYSHGTGHEWSETNPSSENSSLERVPGQYAGHANAPPPPPKADMGEQYGFQGFGGAPDLQQTPIAEEQHGHDGYDPAYAPAPPGHGQQQQYGGYANSGHGNGMSPPPPPPPHAAKPSLPRAPSKLQSARRGPDGALSPARGPQQYDDYGAPVGGAMDTGEKRKSWLKRRFSKNGG